MKKIMFYDEAQKAWVVDTMEIEENEQQEESEQRAANEEESQESLAYI
jgi:hypothetical protein